VGQKQKRTRASPGNTGFDFFGGVFELPSPRKLPKNVKKEKSRETK
jgi:hypothetical protein